MKPTETALMDQEEMESLAGLTDESHPESKAESQWPDPLPVEAYHGVVGDIVHAIEPHSEADPAAILVQSLVAFGSAAGRNAHFVIEADRHYMNLNVVLVGNTAKGRKGTSIGQVMRVFRAVDEGWDADRVVSGLSSGEGLIWGVRDSIEKSEPIKEKNKVVAYQTVVVDPGVEDKRLLAVESEFASVLRVLGRDGNTLSATIRNAWDHGNLRTLTKNSPAKATAAHVSIIGHITRDELRRYLDSTESGNGFANRFLGVCVRRSKSLPEGGALSEVDFATIQKQLAAALDFSRKCERVRFDDTARQLWWAVYDELSEGVEGLLGAVTSRSEAQVLRLATVYAALDCSELIRQPHLKAALAVWEYAEDSARYIFGDALGDPVADEILKALRQHQAGMTRTQISTMFGRNRKASQIGRALNDLLNKKLARMETDDSDGAGRRAERWYATHPGN